MSRLPGLDVFGPYQYAQSSSPLSSPPPDSDDFPALPVPLPKTPPRRPPPKPFLTPRHDNYRLDRSSDVDSMEAQSSPLPPKGEARQLAKMKKTRKYANQRRAQQGQASLTAAIERVLRKREEERRETENYREVLRSLREKGISLGDFFVEMSQPSRWKDERYRGFFNSPNQVQAVLDNWAACKNRKVRQVLETWAVSVVKHLVDREGDQATKSGHLRSRDMEINEAFILKFDLPQLYVKIAKHCPSMVQILHAFATTTRQMRNATETSIAKKTKVSDQCSIQEYT